MALNLTRALRREICVNGSIAYILGPLVLNVYDGTVPTNAESPLSGNNLLVAYVNGATLPAFNLVLVYDETNNALVLDTGEVLQGTAGATGTATFFRIEAQDDDGLSDAIDKTRLRIQGTVGNVSQDLFMGNTTITSGNVKVIGGFALQLLTY